MTCEHLHPLPTINVLHLNSGNLEQDAVNQRLFLAQNNFFANFDNVRWIAGLALRGHQTQWDAVIFENGIQYYRDNGIDMTFDKVLNHELQHIVQFEKNMPSFEPTMQMAIEYGTIPGFKVKKRWFEPKQHMWSKTIPIKEFYSLAKVEDFNVKVKIV